MFRFTIRDVLMLTLVGLILGISSAVLAAELKLVRRIGRPNPDHEKAWNGHVDHASWVDDERIAYWSRSGRITCLKVSTGEIEWTRDGVQDVGSWSLSAKTQRLAYVERLEGLMGTRIVVIDCAKGKQIAQLDSARLASLVGQGFLIPTELALSPRDGKLIFSAFGKMYGRNGHILEPALGRLESSFDVDASPRKWSLSGDGRFVSWIADDEVICVRDLVKGQDVFFQGKRIEKEPPFQTFVIDVPFFSHIRSDGKTVVYTQDNSWATGKLFVHDLANRITASFDARNGHVEMDACFPTRRIALTGTERGLTLLDFDGAVVAHLKDATLQRNTCVEFSPSGKQVVVGSWDNAVYVFDIVD